MAERSARVLSVFNNKAKIMIEKEAMCDKAKRRLKKRSACQKCGTCDSESMILTVDSPLEITAGDVVALEMGGKDLVKASLFLYLTPILFLIGGYLLGTGLGFESEFIRGSIALLLLSVSFLIARKFGEYKEKTYNLKISRIIEPK